MARRVICERRAEAGFALPMAMGIAVAVLTLGLALLELSRMEAVRARRDVTKLQAAAAAEYGLARAQAMAQSQKMPWAVMTYNDAHLSFAPSAQYSGHQVCTLFRDIPLTNSSATYTVVIEDMTGWLATSAHYRIHAYGSAGLHTTHVATDARALTYASFGWLTHSEEGVYFASGDIVRGWVHTNDRMNIWGNPTFTDRVSSGASAVHYAHGGPPSDAPDFQGGLSLNSPIVDIPALINEGHITAIRDRAREATGIWLGSNSGRPYRIVFNSSGKVTISKQNKKGNWESVISNRYLSATNGAIYVEEDVWVQGEVDGQVTVATSLGKDILIVDDLIYAYPAGRTQLWQPGFDPTDPLFNDKLALISGGDVVISKEWNNSWGDMYVAASIAAVTGIFTNDSYTRSPQKTLHIYGAVAQYRRGPVGTTGGKGFLKDYWYDDRFLTAPPPHLPTVGYDFSQWTLYP